ncbi:hypothetical protein V6N13_042687 [Hibiscus sabdariffa]
MGFDGAWVEDKPPRLGRMNDDEGQETSQLKTPPFSDKNGAAGLDKWGCLLNTIEIMGRQWCPVVRETRSRLYGASIWGLGLVGQNGSWRWAEKLGSDIEFGTKPIVETNAESGTDPNDEPVGSDTESGTEPNDKPVSSDTESRTEPIV